MADGVGTAYLGRSFFAALKFVKAELRALVPKPVAEAEAKEQLSSRRPTLPLRFGPGFGVVAQCCSCLARELGLPVMSRCTTPEGHH